MRPTQAVTGLWLALACLILLSPCAEAQSLPRPGSITLYGLVGGANQQMTEVNDILSAQQEELRSEGVLANYELFELNAILGGGAWWQILKRVSVGAEYSYQNRDLQNDVFVGPSGGQVGILNGAGGKVQDVTFNITWYPPLDDGLFLGGGVGFGWSEMYEQIDIRVPTDSQLNSTQRGDWTASGITGQAFLGYHFNFVWGTRLQFRMGYRYLTMSDLEGETTITTQDPVSGNPVTEPALQQLPMGLVDWQFGGWNAVVIFGIPLFGSDG